MLGRFFSGILRTPVRHVSTRRGTDLLMRTLTSQKPSDNELIRCTIFDDMGNIAQHGKEVRRLVLLKEHNLAPRDIRKITRLHVRGLRSPALNSDFVPSLVTRHDCILLNILNVRALIKYNTVVVFDTAHAGAPNESVVSTTHEQFLQQLGDKIRSPDDLPYEFRALEGILMYALVNLQTEMKVHTNVLRNLLEGLEESVDKTRLRYLLIQSKKISQFHQKAQLIRDLVDGLLDNDNELNDLYLTDNHQKTPRLGTNHTEVEILLESYYNTLDEVVQTVENLKSQIRTTEEIINIVLDSNRNELMLLGLKFSTGLLSMGIALYVAAVYGMNLENFIEEADGGFEVVTVLGSILMFLLLFYSVRQLQKLQKVAMTGLMGKEIRMALKLDS